MNRARGITPSRAEIRARRKPERIVPTQVQSCLTTTVWEPMRSREWQAVMARINPDRVVLNGKK
jgi:hypothetical protein